MALFSPRRAGVSNEECFGDVSRTTSSAESNGTQLAAMWVVPPRPLMPVSDVPASKLFKLTAVVAFIQQKQWTLNSFVATLAVESILVMLATCVTGFKSSSIDAHSWPAGKQRGGVVLHWSLDIKSTSQCCRLLERNGWHGVRTHSHSDLPLPWTHRLAKSSSKLGIWGSMAVQLCQSTARNNL